MRTSPSFPSSPITSTLAATMTTMSQGELHCTLPMLEEVGRRSSKVRTTPTFPSSPTTSIKAATMTTMSQGEPAVGGVGVLQATSSPQGH